ncbi:MAG: polysaccharide biosynthesis tyrosine autokinase [Elusimicrobiota bacterium]
MEQYGLTVYDYWRIIRRRKFIIFFSVVSVLIFTWIFTNLQTQVYQATVVVKVEPSLIVPGVSTELLGWDMLAAINTEVKIIKSAVVAKRTALKLGLLPPVITEEEQNSIIANVQSKIEAERVSDTNLIKIMSTGADPDELYKLANVTAEVYIEKGIEDRTRRARELREFIETQLTDAGQKLKESEEKLRKWTEQTGATGMGGHLALQAVNLQTRQADLLKKYTAKHPDVVEIKKQIKTIEDQMRQLPREELEYARLIRDAKLNEELYTLLAKRHKEAQISEADRVQSAFIVTPATRPSYPIKPNKIMNITLGGLVGIFVGFIFALVTEHIDTSIGTIEELETYLQLPAIGIIPHIEGVSRRGGFRIDAGLFRRADDIDDIRRKLIVSHSTKSPFVEAYHTLRTNIKFVKEEMPGPGASILVTSSGVSEGKTLTAINFALAASQVGIKTLYMELDLRRPAVHKIFGIKRAPGFSDCILGKKRWTDILRGTTDFLMGEIALDKIIRSPGLENLKIIPCGSIPPNPVDTLNSPFVGEVLDEMRRSFELIVCDCPPVLLFADSLILSKHVNSVIIVYRVGRIARGALKRTKEQLVSAKANVLGVVLNDIKASEMEPRYGYYYDYKYYADAEKK